MADNAPAPPAPAPHPSPAPIPAGPNAQASSAPAAPPSPPSGASPPSPAGGTPPGARPGPSFFEEIDSLAAGNEPKPPSGTPPPAPPKPGTPAPAKPGTPTPPAPPTGLDEKSLAKMPPQLRQAYTEQNKVLTSVRTELTAAKARLAQLEGARPEEHPAFKTLTEQNQAHQKRIQELEEELKYTSYERTEEYQQKYQQPFEDAYNAGRELVASLKANADEEGNTRPGTAEDFDRIMMVSDENDAADMATALFGTRAMLVMAARMEVKRLNSAKFKAVENYRKSGSEREKKRTEQAAAEAKTAGERAQQRVATFRKLNETILAERAEHMTPAENDEAEAKLVKSEEALASLAFGVITQEQMDDLPPKVKEKIVNGRLPEEEVVKLHSAMWTKASRYGLQERRVKALKARVSELETELAEYRESEPGVGGGHRPGAGGHVMTAEEEIDAMAAGAM